MYVHQEYPKWKYHKNLPPMLIKDAAEDKAIGPEWKNSPADLVESEAPKRKYTPKTKLEEPK